MIYVPLDVDFFENDKILEAGEKAGWLYLAMLCRVKRLKQDGALTTLQIERLQITGWRNRLSMLVSEGLVLLLDDGRYLVIGWLERNPSQAELADYRRKDSDRKKPRSAADSVRIPSGTTTDSEPEEKRREEKRREVEVKPGSLRSVGGAA
jgi:hypothetical protein